MELMERKIGERFEYNGTTLEVELEKEDEKDVCIGCYFSDMKTCKYVKKVTGYCSRALRKDGTDVIFKDVGK